RACRSVQSRLFITSVPLPSVRVRSTRYFRTRSSTVPTGHCQLADRAAAVSTCYGHREHKPARLSGTSLTRASSLEDAAATMILEDDSGGWHSSLPHVRASCVDTTAPRLLHCSSRIDGGVCDQHVCPHHACTSRCPQSGLGT